MGMSILGSTQISTALAAPCCAAINSARIASSWDCRVAVSPPFPDKPPPGPSPGLHGLARLLQIILDLPFRRHPAVRVVLLPGPPNERRLPPAPVVPPSRRPSAPDNFGKSYKPSRLTGRASPVRMSSNTRFRLSDAGAWRRRQMQARFLAAPERAAAFAAAAGFKPADRHGMASWNAPAVRRYPRPCGWLASGLAASPSAREPPGKSGSRRWTKASLPRLPGAGRRGGRLRTPASLLWPESALIVGEAMDSRVAGVSGGSTKANCACEKLARLNLEDDSSVGLSLPLGWVCMPDGDWVIISKPTAASASRISATV